MKRNGRPELDSIVVNRFVNLEFARDFRRAKKIVAGLITPGLSCSDPCSYRAAGASLNQPPHNRSGVLSRSKKKVKRINF